MRDRPNQPESGTSYEMSSGTPDQGSYSSETKMTKMAGGGANYGGNAAPAPSGGGYGGDQGSSGGYGGSQGSSGSYGGKNTLEFELNQQLTNPKVGNLIRFFRGWRNKGTNGKDHGHHEE